MRIWENIKSLILTVLIGLSIYLTGSLWFDNYQGLSLVLANIPTNIRGSFFSEEVEDSQKYVESIVPYRVTVASPDNGKWVLYHDSPELLEAWNLLKGKMENIHEKTEVITGNISEWKDLINRKSIIFEFGDTMDIEVLKLVLPNLKWVNAVDFNNINKIALTKSIEGAVVYVDCKIDNKDLLYKVLLKEEMAEIETFIDGYINRVADVKYVTLAETGTTTFYSGRVIEPNTDVLFPISSKVGLRGNVRKLGVEEYFRDRDAYFIDRLAIQIFQNTDYAKFITEDNGSIYINDDKSSVQIDMNGVIEYINKNTVESTEAVSAGAEYNVALDFIDKFKVYEKVYLLSSKKAEGEYDFRFFLTSDGIPLISSKEPITDDFRALLEVKVENGKVRYFKGKLLEYELGKTASLVSNLTNAILDTIIPKLPAKQTMIVNNVQIGYDVEKLGENYPIWYIEYKVKDEFGKVMLNTIKN